MSNRPCLITAPHGSHQWNPIVVDPDNDHVLHVFLDAPVTCFGVSLAADLRARADREAGTT